MEPARHKALESAWKSELVGGRKAHRAAPGQSYRNAPIVPQTVSQNPPQIVVCHQSVMCIHEIGLITTELLWYNANGFTNYIGTAHHYHHILPERSGS